MKNILASIALCCLISACTVTTRIEVPYQPMGNAAPVAGASAATVSVVAKNGRTTYQDRVSSGGVGWGMKKVIIATNDIPQTVGKAIEQELIARGFRIGSGHATISVEILKFNNEFRYGSFSSDAIAGVELNVNVRDPANSIVFTKTYDGTGKESDFGFRTDSRARTALIKAFQNVINSMISDEALQAAIFAAQQPRTSGATTSPSP